jgi:integrase
MSPDASQVSERTTVTKVKRVIARVTVQSTRRVQARRAKLTDAYVRKLRMAGAGKQEIVWDDPAHPEHVRGLHVQVYASGRVTWFVRLRDPNSKSRYRVVKLGDRTEILSARARDLAAAAILEARLGRQVSAEIPDVVTVSDAVARFKKEYRTTGKGRRIENDRKWSRPLRRLTDALGSRALESVTTADLQAIVDGTTLEIARDFASKVRQLFKHAHAERWIPTGPNPADRVRSQGLPEIQGVRKRVVDAGAFARALGAADASGHPILSLYLRVLAGTGHRPGKVLRCTWGDVDMNGRVTVRGDKKNRDVTLPPVADPALAQALVELREITGEMPCIFGARDEAEAEKQATSLRDSWRTIANKTEGLRGIAPKHFRSTAASEAYREAHAVALKAAQERLQHKSARTTEENYVVTH